MMLSSVRPGPSTGLVFHRLGVRLTPAGVGSTPGHVRRRGQVTASARRRPMHPRVGSLCGSRWGAGSSAASMLFVCMLLRLRDKRLVGEDYGVSALSVRNLRVLGSDMRYCITDSDDTHQ